MSITSTFYVQIFCTEIVSAAFSSYILALLKNLYVKRACITLMKLTTGPFLRPNKFKSTNKYVCLGKKAFNFLLFERGKLDFHKGLLKGTSYKTGLRVIYAGNTFLQSVLRYVGLYSCLVEAKESPK